MSSPSSTALTHEVENRVPVSLLMGMLFVSAITMVSWVSQKPTSITNVLGALKTRIYAWAYLFNGPNIIKREFNQSHGKPFEVHAPDVRMVFVSSSQHIKEIDRAPDSVLSLNGAAKHPLYTMNGFNWFDRRGVEGIGFVRALRTLLTNNLPQLLPDLRTLTMTRWNQMLSKKNKGSGTTTAPLYPMMMELVVLLNARSLFGEDLIKDDGFMTSALGYVEETLLNAEIVKLLPKWLAPTLGGFLSRFLHSHKTFFKKLIPNTEQRLREQEAKSSGLHVPRHADCIQWIIETAPKQNPWSAERVIYEFMAIWFGSVHILSTTIVYVIHDLCLHPEYIEPLLNELETSYTDFIQKGQGLPLLDSFIKESARLTPVESMSVRRCALQPFSLSDGTQVAVGEWACAPSGAINTSADYYPLPDEFSGFRFVRPEDLPETKTSDRVPRVTGIRQPTPSKLVDIDYSFLMWGTGRMACPGRYYASAFIKVVIAELLLNYDFALVKPDAPRWISWRVAKIPRPWTKLTFVPKNQKTD